jgi:hypothetical protein
MIQNTALMIHTSSISSRLSIRMPLEMMMMLDLLILSEE